MIYVAIVDINIYLASVFLFHRSAKRPIIVLIYWRFSVRFPRGDVRHSWFSLWCGKSPFWASLCESLFFLSPVSCSFVFLYFFFTHACVTQQCQLSECYWIWCGWAFFEKNIHLRAANLRWLIVFGRRLSLFFKCVSSYDFKKLRKGSWM